MHQHHHFATYAVESRSFHRNAQKLTANTNNEQILNIVIKYFVFGSW